ncbi:hypothetical protein HanIR_Chr12g0597791 [Helianthus annuus]|nr:hypothetical protein HanIR_Chr12g0597791 [Helianthus annuus]
MDTENKFSPSSLPIKKPPSHHSFSHNFCYKSNNHNYFTVIVSPAITLIPPLLACNSLIF